MTRSRQLTRLPPLSEFAAEQPEADAIGSSKEVAPNDAAVEAIQTSRLPQSLVQEIVEAKRYLEGRPARIEVTSKKKAVTAPGK